MSKYAEYDTTITDGPALADALKAMGFVVECHNEPTTLFGYHGDARREKAHIIIRQQYTGIGASNDIGFLKGADGRYQAIISEYDRGAKFNESWMGELKQSYTEQRQMAMARQKGYLFQGRELVKLPNGKQQVRLQFAAR